MQLTHLSFPLDQIQSFVSRRICLANLSCWQSARLGWVGFLHALIKKLLLIHHSYMDIFHRFCTSNLKNITSYDLIHILRISLTTILFGKTSITVIRGSRFDFLEWMVPHQSRPLQQYHCYWLDFELFEMCYILSVFLHQ